MENLSHSVSKKAYNGNGLGAKTVYDDVFGGPPKFGVPTLSPRVDDYTEIFGRFHASRASSIPIVDLSAVDYPSFSFDVRSSQFDYSEVFSGFNGLDFAVSFEELFNQSKPTYDSSDEDWTPAQSETLSDESEPSASSERNRSLSNGESYQSCDGIKQFNMSYNKTSQRSKEDMSNGMAVVNDGPPSQKVEDRNTHLQLTNDLIPNVDFSGCLKEGKQFRKTMSHPSNNSFGIQTLGTDLKPVGYGKTAYCMNGAFLTVSDISLRTQPSQLPPPSRPPPDLAVKDGDSDRQKSKLKASKSFAFGERASDSSLPFFDVEVDASSSAAVSAAAMKDAMEKAQAKLKSAKELMERKKEGVQSRTILGLKNDTKHKEGKASKAFDGSNCLKDERVHGTCQREHSGMKTFAGEEMQKVMKTTQVVSDSIEGEKCINVAKKSADKKHGKEHRSSQESYKPEATVAWREAAQFYEVVETGKSRNFFEQTKDERVLVQNTRFNEHGQEKKATPTFQLQEEDNMKINVDKETHELDGNKGRLKATKESSRQEEHEKKVKVNQEVSKHENEKKPIMAHHDGDIEKILTEDDKSEESGDLAEVQQKENEVEAEKKLKEATERIEDDKRHKDAHKRVENERRLKETLEKPRMAKHHGDIVKILTDDDRSEEGEKLAEVQQKVNEVQIEKKIKAAAERVEDDKRHKDAHEREENERRLKETLERERYEKRLKEATEQAEIEKRPKEALDWEEKEQQQREACEREEKERRQKEAHEREVNDERLKVVREREENEKALKEVREREDNEKRLKDVREREDNEKRLKDVREREDNEKNLKEDLEQEENKKKLKEALEQEETEKRLKMVLEREEKEKKQKMACERDEIDKRLVEDLRQQEIEKKLRGALQQETNAKPEKEAHEGEENDDRLNKAREREEHEKRIKEAWEQDGNKKQLQEAHEREESEKRSKEVFKRKEIEKRSEEANECEETQKRTENASYWEELKGRGKDHEQNERDANERKLKSDLGTCVHIDGENFKASDGSCKLDDYENLQPGQTGCKQNKNSVKVKKTKGALSFEEDRIMRAEPIDSEWQVEVIEVVDVLFDEQFNSSGMAQDDPQYENYQIRMKDATDSLHDTVTESVEAGIGIGQTLEDRNKQGSEIASNRGKPNALTYELGERGTNVREVQVTFDKEESKDKFMSSQVVMKFIENGRKMGADRPTVLEAKNNAQRTAQKISTSQNTERKENFNDILAPEEREREGRIKRERELEKDRLRKIEEEREREKEREKDRMAVDRATLEARERAERAAVERATAEFRQRAMSEARERLEKASAEARERSLVEKASMEARLRAERTAVERVTAEARERAFQKAMAEKATFEARERVEISVADKSSVSYKNGGMRQNYSYSDLQDGQCQGIRPFNGSIYSYSSVHGGVEGESAQRCKARLERHRRTAERAAKALAEKNMRDLLAQREQAERNRLAEALDAEVKRWSSGKEGKLRALLSTLQYILGPDSGWQPIPLTEVITSAAVKKAYRKATLCVHPDKLQQRGASIQQKYICEKVFDLLKEAWNKFNSEER